MRQIAANLVYLFLFHLDSCNQALRMEKITATTFSSPYNQPSEAKLDSSRCWKPSTNSDPNDHLQVDLGRVKLLTGVVTEEAASSVFVESYKIQYSLDGVEWKYYPNFDGTPKVFNIFFASSPFLSDPQAFPL